MDNQQSETEKGLLDGRQLTSYFLAALLGSAITFGGLSLSNRTQPAPIIIQPPATLAPTATPSPLRIYINGAVTSPGIYLLPTGSIAQEAIRQAGGFTSQAYADAVNLAQPLADGMQIYVPTLAEKEALAPTLLNPNSNNGTGLTAAGLINLNRATAAELETLPGIGPSTAAQIITYREQNGPFATIEAIMDVPGIGPAKFNALKDLVVVE